MVDKKKQKKIEKHRRRISDDEARLWEKVARTATPIKDSRAPVVQSSSSSSISDEQEFDPEMEITATQDSPSSTNTSQRSSRTLDQQSSSKVPPLANFDRRDSRNLASGRIEISARLDLHGMRQSEAYTALRSFLLTAQSRGYRHVLVITGKGQARDEYEGSFFNDAETGVLKRQVPVWLNEAEFRPLVVSFSQASRRHGGEGALYIRLRRPKS